MRYRITALAKPTHDILNELVIDKMKELNLVKDIIKEEQSIVNGAFVNNIVNTRAEPIEIDNVSLDIQILGNRIDYFCEVEKYIPCETVKQIFEKLLMTKQFNRFAVEVSKDYEAAKLLEVVSTHLGSLNQLDLDVSTTDRFNVNGCLCIQVKKIFTDGISPNIRQLSEINNIVEEMKENHKIFVENFEEIYERLINETQK
ncbi:hypothetical protein RZE82_07225 [Mollicutes bacterium LVI A0039]|nr:hypothetical protein RZE82_07225 [Mollicutes bacterium LVI A0039]